VLRVVLALRGDSMRRRSLLLWFGLALFFGACQAPASAPRGSEVIVVASKDFTEQDILGELLAQQIERKTNLTVERKPRLGGSYVCHQAIINGKIDAYIEYTGTAATVSQLFQDRPIPTDAKRLYQELQTRYAQAFNLTILPSLGFENTFAIVIRGDDARQKNIRTLSQAAQYTPQWRAGFGYEFAERQDGLAGLAKTYNLTFARSPQAMDLGLIYRALVQKQIDLTAGNSTDGQIARLGLVILQDDKRYFPPYEAVPIVRTEILQKYPQVKAAIAELAGLITAEEMQKMNNAVEGELRDPKTVVQEFLAAHPGSTP